MLFKHTCKITIVHPRQHFVDALEKVFTWIAIWTVITFGEVFVLVFKARRQDADRNNYTSVVKCHVYVVIRLFFMFYPIVKPQMN